MLERRVRRQDRVVGLYDGARKFWSRVDTELELGLLAIVSGESLEDQCTETGTSSTTEGVEHEEALKTAAVVCKAADLIHHNVDLLLSNGVVTAGV